MRHQAWISTDAIDLSDILAQVDDAEHGAVATFVGQVRSHDEAAAGEVASLRYTCHPEAQDFIEGILARTIAAHDPQEQAVSRATHRIGDLEVGDLALVVAVGSAHRELAFTLCRAIVEAVKHELPVWKQQFEVDGSHAWSGLGA